MIKLIVLDVDGTLTDGRLYMDDKDNCLKAFDVKDGFAIAQWIKLGGLVAIITGKTSEIVRRRKEELGIQELAQGVSNKVVELNKLLVKYSLSLDEVAYIGDDINDLGVMSKLDFLPAQKMQFLKSQKELITQLAKMEEEEQLERYLKNL